MKIEFGQIIMALLLLIGAAGAIAEYGNDINIPGNFTGLNGIFSGDISANDITVSGTVDGVDISTIPGTYVAKSGDTMTGDLTIINSGVNTFANLGSATKAGASGLSMETDSGDIEWVFGGSASGFNNQLYLYNRGIPGQVFGINVTTGVITTDVNSKKIGGMIYADQYDTWENANAARIGRDIIFNQNKAPGNGILLFRNDSNSGSYHGIDMEINDNSTTGDLNVNGIRILQNSPADRGGDTSAIYARQYGAGNTMSIYKLGGGGNGTALEIEADLESHTIRATSAGSGAVYKAAIANISSQGGLIVQPTNDSWDVSNIPAVKVSNAAYTTDTAHILMNGEIWSEYGIIVGGGIPNIRVFDGANDGRLTMDGDNVQIVRNAFRNGSGWFRVDDAKKSAVLTLASDNSIRYENADAGSGGISFTTRYTFSPTGNLTISGTPGCIGMKSPDGTAYTLMIANGGTTTVSAGTCV